MHMIELNLLKPFYECITTSIQSSQVKDSQDSDIPAQKKQKFVYKNKKKLERELEAEELRTYLKRIKRAKRIEEIGTSGSKLISNDIKQELDTALQVTELPEVEKYYIKIIKRKDKDFKQQLKELDDLKFKLRILDYGVLQLNAIENAKSHIIDSSESSKETLKKVGFHDLARQMKISNPQQRNIKAYFNHNLMEPSKSNDLDCLKKSREKRFNSGASSKFTTTAVAETIKEEKEKVEARKQKFTDHRFKLKRRAKHLYKTSLELSSNKSNSTVDQEESNKAKSSSKSMKVDDKQEELKTEGDSKKDTSKKKRGNIRSEYYLRIVKHYLSNRDK